MVPLRIPCASLRSSFMVASICDVLDVINCQFRELAFWDQYILCRRSKCCLAARQHGSKTSCGETVCGFANGIAALERRK